MLAKHRPALITSSQGSAPSIVSHQSTSPQLVGSGSAGLFDRYFSPRAMFQFLREASRPLQALFRGEEERIARPPNASSYPMLGMGLGTAATLGIGMALSPEEPIPPIPILRARVLDQGLSPYERWEAVDMLEERFERDGDSVFEPEGRDTFFRDIPMDRAFAEYPIGELFESGGTYTFDIFMTVLESGNPQLREILANDDFSHWLGKNSTWLEQSITYEEDERMFSAIYRLTGNRSALDNLMDMAFVQAGRPNEIISGFKRLSRNRRDAFMEDVDDAWRELVPTQQEEYIREEIALGFAEVSFSEIPRTFLALQARARGWPVPPLRPTLEDFCLRESPVFRDLPEEGRADLLRLLSLGFDADTDTPEFRQSMLDRLGPEVRLIGPEGIPEPMIREVLGNLAPEPGRPMELGRLEAEGSESTETLGRERPRGR